MTKLKRTEDGGYIIKGKKYETLRGTRRQVHEYETAYKTAGGLLKEDLVQNNKGRIVSKAKFDEGPKLLKNLTKRGFFTKKGKFGHTKMKTRKLRKKLTRKNRRKMKGGATITELKEQLGEVKEMIPKQITKLQENDAYKGAVELAGEEGEKMFEENIFNPLKDLNETIKEPIDKIETKINELESNFDEGKGKLKNEIETQFTEIKKLIKDNVSEIKEKIPGYNIPGWSMTPPGVAFGLVETGINKMIALKETEILKQIDELTLDDIAEKAVEIAKSPISTVADSIQKEEPVTEDNTGIKDEIKEIEDGLTPDQQKELNKKKKDCEIAALNEVSNDSKKLANIAATKFQTLASNGMGGKKKSKGKK